MKQRFVLPVLIAFTALLCMPAVAQVTGTVKGVVKDTEGKPIAGAVVRWVNQDSGQKYEIKTNNKGEYFSLGITPGRYNAQLFKDGQQIFYLNGLQVSVGELDQDFDLQKEMAHQAGANPEQAKQQEQAAKIAKENATIKALNEKLTAAKTSADAGNLDAAIATMNEATQMDPTRDLLWAKLGDYTLSGAGKQTDASQKSKMYADAATDFQKAIDLKQKSLDTITDPAKKTEATKVVAQFYNNMGQGLAKTGKTDDAVNAYNKAAQLDPTGAGQYYYNLGAILTNANVTNDSKLRQQAVDAFDKAISLDPNRADAYYWKATNLIGAATLEGNKMVAPPGTAEAFQKYLDLQPTGPHAEEAKAMLASIGGTVETQFGKQKGKPIKK